MSEDLGLLKVCELKNLTLVDFFDLPADVWWLVLRRVIIQIKKGQFPNFVVNGPIFFVRNGNRVFDKVVSLMYLN